MLDLQFQKKRKKIREKRKTKCVVIVINIVVTRLVLHWFLETSSRVANIIHDGDRELYAWENALSLGTGNLSRKLTSIWCSFQNLLRIYGLKPIRLFETPFLEIAFSTPRGSLLKIRLSPSEKYFLYTMNRESIGTPLIFSLFFFSFFFWRKQTVH